LIIIFSILSLFLFIERGIKLFFRIIKIIM
jgi:hypothetical protein